MILTLGGAGEWRKTGCPSSSFTTFPRCTALVKGVLYFLGYTGSRFDHIAAYDLDMEKWRPDLLYLPLSIQRPVTLVELSDCLVAVDYRPTKSNASIDLWFLTDTEKVLWSKRHTVTIPYQSCWSPCDTSHGYPLWVLDDGKIVFWISQYWIFDRTHRVHSLWVYDPRTNICTGSVEMPCYAFAGVYKGSLLAGLPWIKN
jgi:F-box interacting protein